MQNILLYNFLADLLIIINKNNYLNLKMHLQYKLSIKIICCTVDCSKQAI